MATVDVQLQSLRMKIDTLRSDCRAKNLEFNDLVLRSCALLEEMAALLDNLAQSIDRLEKAKLGRR